MLAPDARYRFLVARPGIQKIGCIGMRLTVEEAGQTEVLTWVAAERQLVNPAIVVDGESLLAVVAVHLERYYYFERLMKKLSINELREIKEEGVAVMLSGLVLNLVANC